MLNIEYEFEKIERPRKSRPLPKEIPIEEVQEMLGRIANPKHKTALSTIYGLGLRRSELLNLRLSDIDFKREVITIRNAKGNKDRTLPLPEKLHNMLACYIKANKPLTWPIEGWKPGKRYSATSLQNIFDQSMSKVVANHRFTLHCLSHSPASPAGRIATHLLENGTDIRYIQELLGHRSSKTTETCLAGL